MLMTLAFIVVAFSAQALAWRCAKLDAENERLREQLRRLSTGAAKEAGQLAKTTSRQPLMWS